MLWWRRLQLLRRWTCGLIGIGISPSLSLCISVLVHFERPHWFGGRCFWKATRCLRLRPLRPAAQRLETHLSDQCHRCFGWVRSDVVKECQGIFLRLIFSDVCKFLLPKCPMLPHCLFLQLFGSITCTVAFQTALLWPFGWPWTASAHLTIWWVIQCRCGQ